MTDTATCPTCGAQEPDWNAARAADFDAHLDDYPSRFAMEAAVELEVHSCLGNVQTQTLGKVIQRAIDRALAEKSDQA